MSFSANRRALDFSVRSGETPWDCWRLAAIFLTCFTENATPRFLIRRGNSAGFSGVTISSGIDDFVAAPAAAPGGKAFTGVEGEGFPLSAARPEETRSIGAGSEAMETATETARDEAKRRRRRRRVSQPSTRVGISRGFWREGRQWRETSPLRHVEDAPPLIIWRILKIVRSGESHRERGAPTASIAGS